MRIIDADELIKDIKNSDLEFVADGAVIRFILNTINKQPTVSKVVEIKNISTFDNRKS